MTDLFNEVPEAQLFCDGIIKDINNYKLFSEEHFDSYTVGVLATSSVDAHGDMFAESALQEMIDHIGQRPLWTLAQHNPLIQPIGRVVAARLFYSEKSSTHFVAGVLGIYDAKDLPSFSDVGVSEDETIPQSVSIKEIEIKDTDFRLSLTLEDLDPDFVNEIIKSAPEVVNRKVERCIRKAFDSQTIITIIIPLFFILQTPFLKKFQERLGEKTADAVLEGLGWIKTNLAKAIDARFNREVLYELTFQYHACSVQFLIDTKDPAIISEAIDTIQDAVQRAVCLLENGAHLQIDKLVYLYDHRESKKWLPLHAATKSRGVISNRPLLVSLDSFKGFSVQGTVSEEQISLDDKEII